MKKRAFTLVELIISLIVILIIIASLAPIITKKLGKNPVSIKAETKIIEPNGEIFIPFEGSIGKKDKYFECSEKVDNYITCTIKNIPVPVVNAILVGGGGGGGRAIYLESYPNQHSFDASNTHTLLINNTIKNAKVNLYGQGGSGGGSVFLEKIKEEASYIDTCPDKTERVVVSSGKEYCVTKYNVRPDDINDYYHANFKTPIETKATLKEIKVKTNFEFDRFSNYANMPQCKVDLSSKCSDADNYPKCGRTICSQEAAKALCAALDLGGNNCKDSDGNPISCKGRWHLLPANSMYNIFYENLVGRYGNSRNSLQFCYSNVAGDPCSRDTSSILGEDGNCTYFTGSGGGNIVAATFCGSASVRCLMEKSIPKSSTFVIYTGGGGGAGAKMNNLMVPQDVIDDCTKNHRNCYFYSNMRIVYGVSAPYLKINSDTKEIPLYNGNDGEEASIEIKTKEGKTLWGYKVEGGKGGKGPTIDAPGEGGGEATLCWEHNGTSWGEPFDCKTEARGTATYGPSGATGSVSEFTTLDEFKAADAGIGGHYSDYKYRDTTGEGGDSAKFTSKTQTSASSVQGKSGKVYGTFGVKYPGSSAGGGGGGAFVMAKNIKIPADRNLDVQIGAGGIGAKSTTNGTSGGNTFIAFGNNIFITAYGGEGGEIGRRGNWYEKRKPGKGGTGGKVKDNKNIYNQGIGITMFNGGDGGDGIFQEILTENDITSDLSDSISVPALGGLGGRSGISVSQNIIQYAQGCGGLFADNTLGCENRDNVNGLDTSYLSSKIPAFNPKNGYYGSYGAGGGGGGWKYDEATGKEYIGNGAEGQGGYIYIWW